MFVGFKIKKIAIVIAVLLAAAAVAAIIYFAIIYFANKSNSDLSNDLSSDELSSPPAVMRALNAFTDTSPKPIFMLTDVNGNISTHDPMITQLNSDWKIKGNLCIENVCANENDIKNPIGTILQYAGDTAPNESYLFCDGSSYSITDYPALFSVLGFKYGGIDGNFNVPNLSGRTVLGKGQSTSSLGQVRNLGEKGGTERETLTVDQIPSHSHSGITNTAGNHTHAFGILNDISDGNSSGALDIST